MALKWNMRESKKLGIVTYGEHKAHERVEKLKGFGTKVFGVAKTTARGLKMMSKSKKGKKTKSYLSNVYNNFYK